MLMWSPCPSCPSGGQQHQLLAAHTGKGDCAAGRAVIGQAEEGVCAVQGLHTDMVGPPHVTMAVNISIYCSIGLYTHCMYIHVCKFVVNCRNIKAHMYLHTYVHTWSLQGILYVYSHTHDMYVCYDTYVCMYITYTYICTYVCNGEVGIYVNVTHAGN